MSQKMTKAREQLIDMFTSSLEENKLPWQQPWYNDGVTFGSCENPVTGTTYHGVNAAILWLASMERGYKDTRWCTFNQAKDKGWSVKKGEKGVPVEFWSFYDTKNRVKLSVAERERIIRDEPERYTEIIPIAAQYTVFNYSQISGVPELPSENRVAPEFKDKLLETLAKNYLESQRIELKPGNLAAYVPITDNIIMPARESFVSEQAYYDTLFHEATHSTAHKARCNRTFDYDVEKERANEELIAEIGGAFVMNAAIGEVSKEVSENNKAYIQSWGSLIKDNPNAIFSAIKQAEKACDFICEKGELEQLLTAHVSYDIYQFKPEISRDIRFTDYRTLQEQNISIRSEMYDKVYSGFLKDGENLNSLFEKFNVDPPEDFIGHTLSVGDVIVIGEGNNFVPSFCDSLGFRVVEGFFDPLPKLENQYNIESNPDTVSWQDRANIQELVINTDGSVMSSAVIYTGSDIACQDVLEALQLGELTLEEVKELPENYGPDWTDYGKREEREEESELDL